MFLRPRREKLFPQKVTELPDRTATLCEIQKSERALSQLKVKRKERSQVLESLKEHLKELHEGINERQARDEDIFLKSEGNDAVEKAKIEREEVLQKEADIVRLKEEYAELKERKQNLEHQVQRQSVYKSFMERVLKITKFEDVEALKGYVETLFHFWEHFYQKEMKVQDEVDQQRKILLTLQGQYKLLIMQKNNLPSQLQAELERTRAEAAKWEREWIHIQETAAKKTLVLAQIKIVTLNLYEMTGGKVGDGGVDMTDTEAQLDQIRMFVEDQNDIVNQYQIGLQRASGGRKPGMAQNSIKPRKK